METSQMVRLINKAQEGDTKAFEKLIRAKSKNISYIALSMLKNQHDAEDAAQDAIESMLEHIKGLQDPEAFEAWMYRIVYRSCLDIQKGKKRQKATDIDEMSKMDIFEERSALLPHENSVKVEASQLLLSKIKELPDNYRNCLYLFYFEEMSYDQIAETLESSVKDVSNWLERGKKNLKAAINYETIKEKNPAALEASAFAAAFALDFRETAADSTLVEDILRKLFAESMARRAGILLSSIVGKIVIVGAAILTVGLIGMFFNGSFASSDGISQSSGTSTEGTTTSTGEASENRQAQSASSTDGHSNIDSAEPVETAPPAEAVAGETVARSDNTASEQNNASEGTTSSPTVANSPESTEQIIIENEAYYGSVDPDNRHDPTIEDPPEYLTNEVETVTNSVTGNEAPAGTAGKAASESSQKASSSSLSKTADFTFRALALGGTVALAAGLVMEIARRMKRRQR